MTLSARLSKSNAKLSMLSVRLFLLRLLPRFECLDKAIVEISKVRVEVLEARWIGEVDWSEIDRCEVDSLVRWDDF